MDSEREHSPLKIEGLTKRFGGHLVIDRVSCEISERLITTLVGPNGAGKTTLFNLISGELVPDSGHVTLNVRTSPHSRTSASARRRIGRSFQDLKLFELMTVEENILTVLEPGSGLWQRGGRSAAVARRERVGEIAHAVGLGSKLDTRAVDLSYGERKLLNLARVIAFDAPLWLLDEPASGLDHGVYDLFNGLLRKAVSEGVTIFIIEHNLDIVKELSDQIMFLEGGRLVAIGQPAEILTDPRFITSYFGEKIKK